MPRDIHPSVRLAWAIASHEAGAAGSPEIEPVHLFVALLQILDDAWHEDAAHLGLTAVDTAVVERLAAEARPFLGLDADGITRLRRKTRRDLQMSAQPAPSAELHRSARLRGLFSLADELAARDGSPVPDLQHLLRATLAFPSPDLAGVVPGRGAEKPELTWETRIHRFADDLDLGRVTILVSDIEGSTSLKSRFGDRACAKIFRAHDELFREHMAAVPGAQIIKSLGDGFLLAFPSEATAVRFALLVQAALRTRTPLARVPVHVRMGIHGGEILQRAPSGSTLSEPFFGIAIDLASRVSSLARGNQILVDGVVERGARAPLAADPGPGLGPVEWRSYGRYWVKGSDEPLEIFEVGETGQALFQRPGASPKAGPVDDGGVSSDTRPDIPPPGPIGSAPQRRPPTPGLDLFGTDLTRAAREGRLAPVLGRHDEILALARHLSRTSKRNVLAVGDAGVGKTAVVEGFAQWVATAASPPLDRLRVVQVAVGEILAGTRHRGDLEERVQGILKDAMSDPDVVLFLDEIHLALSSGEGADLASLLKPALARENFRCIGATTTAEYDRFLKSDPAFIRRFQLLRIEEPGQEAAIEICRGWARRIEDRQGVEVSEAAVQAAVRLSHELIRSRALPDKAIDLLENAASRMALSTLSPHAVAPAKQRPLVDARQVELTLEAQFGIAVRRQGTTAADSVRAGLQAQLIGQREAVEEIAGGLAACDLRPRSDRPRAIYLFAGPTGVGKTFAAELISEILFGADALFRVNMSELKERHELARLTGAPPGFVGHEGGSALFLHLERHPQGLILLDEAEKAHPEVLDWFLQVFDKGTATDPRGRPADFRQQVFVLTCNAPEGVHSDRIGFVAGHTSGAGERAPAGPHATAIRLPSHFRSEFVARLDRVVHFRALRREDYRELLERALPGEVHRLPDDLVERILSGCEQAAEGARGFRRLFDAEILPLMLERD